MLFLLFLLTSSKLKLKGDNPIFSDCELCNLAVSYISGQLADPYMRSTVTLALKDYVCGYVDVFYRDICELIILDHFPYLMDDIESLMNQYDVCTELGVCP